MPLVDAAAAAALARLGAAAPRFGHFVEEDEALRALGRQRRELKPQQLEALAAWRRGADFIGQLPCGFGKTLLFQLPALLAPGGGVAISPLSALMRTQVEALPPGAAAAAAKHGLAHAWLLYAAGAVQLLYTAPESAAKHAALLRWACAKRGCACVAVDEAHCALPEPVGNLLFRPDYGELRTVLARLRGAAPLMPLMALTATATREERTRELPEALGLRPDHAIVHASVVRRDLVVRTLVAPTLEQIAALQRIDPTRAAVRAAWRCHSSP
jgi:ATP-dependent DNA helicase RecQ